VARVGGLPNERIVMAERAHSLSTCRIPLSALTYYYLET
jgi:hypothetical protein